jgi:hypothetical protein
MSLDPRTGTAPDEEAVVPAVEGPSGPSTAQIAAPVVTPPALVVPVAVAGSQGASQPASPRSSGSGAGPVSTRGGRGRIEARQVQRVLTRIDPWSVLKVALLLSLAFWLILVVAGVVLWRVAVATGTIGKFENFLAGLFAEQSFVIDGAQILRGSMVAGLVIIVTGAVRAVVFSVLFTLIAGLTGGRRRTVIELETARRVGRGDRRR